MPKIFLLLLFFGTLIELKAQGIVTFKENIFNNNRFKIDGQEAKADEVARLMANFESSQKNFVEGHKQMGIGSGTMILGVALLAAGSINFVNFNGSREDLNTYILLNGLGLATVFIGRAIRKKGKRRVESSVGEYNLLNERSDKSTVSFQITKGKLGLRYSF